MTINFETSTLEELVEFFMSEGADEELAKSFAILGMEHAGRPEEDWVKKCGTNVVTAEKM